MNSPRKMRLAIFITAMLGTGVAFAHTGATGIVKERMDLMGMLGDAQKVLTAMFRGKVPYDAEKVRAAAVVIENHGGEQMTRLFPEGSLKHPSEALPAVWQDWEGFQKLADDLATYARVLQERAEHHDPNDTSLSAQPEAVDLMGTNTMMSSGDDVDGQRENATQVAEKLRTQPAKQSFLRVIQACTECHTDFRKEQN